jgi:adenylyltransferase/sulfurtransferase
MEDRYSRQTVLASIGTAGQEKLLQSKIAVIGCGALGTHIASNLARAGIGHIRVLDRDVVELNNLQRQTLFDETDLGKPKVEAALEKLRKINSEITIEGLVKDLHNGNIEEMIEGFDLVMDATDNIPTRMIVNDACVKKKVPWIYAGVIRSEGMVMSILPEGPCLRCLLPEIPPAGSMTSCELAGVMNTVPAIIAAIQCTEAFKILLNQIEKKRKLIVYDVWTHRFNGLNINKNPACACCGKGEFTFLDNPGRDVVMGLCEDSVQIIPPRDTRVDLGILTSDLAKAGSTVNVVISNDHLVRFLAEGKQITVYGDGRALVKGTGDNGVAKAVYSRYLGL